MDVAYNQDVDCVENEEFKTLFFENIHIIDNLITVDQNEKFQNSLEFISQYAPVSFEKTLNYARIYPYGIYETDRKDWLKWYEENKCSNIQLNKYKSKKKVSISNYLFK